MRFDRIFLRDASSVPLATVLEKRKLQGNNQLKLLLSYLLAKAVWQYYESDWMTPSWTKHVIHFMRELLPDSDATQEISALIHEPYLTTELRSLSSSHDFESDILSNSVHRLSLATHRFPKILALGIMLLEIELGEAIEQRRVKTAAGPIENDDQQTAGWIIFGPGAPAWEARNTYQALKEIIAICIKPEYGKLGNDDATASQCLYRYVVAPLGELFKGFQGQEPESFMPDPKGIHFNKTELPSGIIGRTQAKVSHRAEANTSEMQKNGNLMQSPRSSPSRPIKFNHGVKLDPPSAPGIYQVNDGTESSGSEDGGLLEAEHSSNPTETW